MKDKFAVVILSHGRAEKVITIPALRKHGYTGDIYLVCDTSDSQLEKYKELYGDKVLVFDKADYQGKFDKMDNFGKKNVVVYARNAVYDLAKSVGLKYIAVLDDDYNCFEWRVNEHNEYCKRYIYSLDDVFKAFLQYLKSSPIHSICFAQSGDFIGGKHNVSLAQNKIVKRKMMNLFFFDVDRPIEFIGTINEDLTASVAEAIKGNITLTCPLVTLNQKITQSNSGGLTDIYLDFGTYVKSFYSVMYAPSAVKISLMGNKDKRLHHSVTWKLCAPKILRKEHGIKQHGTTKNNT